MFSMLLLGFALGVIAALPVAYFWSRRTERRVRQLEQRTRSAERLAELGTLTGGLAHEIKNPLSTLGLNVQLIEEDLLELARSVDAQSQRGEQFARVRRRIEGLHRETARLRDILEDFLRFAGRINLDLQPTDVNELISELMDFFEPQAEHARVRLRPDLSADPATAEVDANLLKQALLNLLINACHAMTAARDKADTPHGGANELMLKTVNGRSLGADQLLIHVIDTGPGIAPEAVEKIFHPYFSAKRGGSGLGLPTSRRIIEEHQGTLSVHAAPGQGSDFVIRLPVSRPAPSRQPPAASRQPLEPGKRPATIFC